MIFSDIFGLIWEEFVSIIVVLLFVLNLNLIFGWLIKVIN